MANVIGSWNGSARYAVEIQETVSYSIWIDADSEEEAADKAREMLTAGELIDIEDKAWDQESLGLEVVQVFDQKERGKNNAPQ